MAQLLSVDRALSVVKGSKKKPKANKKQFIVFSSMFPSIADLRADTLRFFYAYGILALVTMAAVSFGSYIYVFHIIIPQ